MPHPVGVLAVLHQRTQRRRRGREVDLGGAEVVQRARPVERLRYSGRLLQVVAVAQLLHDGHDLTAELGGDLRRARAHDLDLALEAAGRADDQSVEEAEKSLYDARFLLARPVLQALQQSPAVLLVDEVDRADDEFEAFLLEVLSTYQVSIPELGTVRATTPPIVVLTSNRTRELHDALKRRCLYHWIDHPGLDREVEILRSRAPEVSETLRRQAVELVQQLRARDDLQKPPGVAETLDWARSLHHLGTAEIDLESASATLGALVKYREDADRVRQALDQMLRP